MKRFLKSAALLLAAVIALTSAGSAFALPASREEEQLETSAAFQEAERRETSALLLENLQAHVSATRKLAHRTRFDGFCAAYVHWQLMAEGIWKKYRSGDAWQEFSKFSKERMTDGGYLVETLPADRYSLESALRDIQAQNRDARRILVCFRYGTGSLRRFGHVVYIYAMSDGFVYYTESFDTTVDSEKYRSGTPICTDIRSFCREYEAMRLAGVVHFYLPGEMSGNVSETDRTFRATDYRLAKLVVYGRLEADGEASSSVDADGNGRLTLADCEVIRRAVLRGDA
ncbi:MAG: hypothetical protein ILO68_08550 [Clostridia bacterium]|nr:hypothetical protein [Clostridia bacterium]